MPPRWPSNTVKVFRDISAFWYSFFFTKLLNNINDPLSTASALRYLDMAEKAHFNRTISEMSGKSISFEKTHTFAFLSIVFFCEQRSVHQMQIVSVGCVSRISWVVAQITQIFQLTYHFASFLIKYTLLLLTWIWRSEYVWRCRQQLYLIWHTSGDFSVNVNSARFLNEKTFPSLEIQLGLNRNNKTNV